MKHTVRFFLALLITCSMSHLAQGAASAKTAAVQVKLHDLELLDQAGRSQRFKSDVIGDKIVAISFTYTTCTTICPILDSILVKVQEKLGTGLNKDFHLVTVSIDPVTDIPARLNAYAKKLKARPGWTFLTGKKPDVEKVLLGLDMYSADILNHPPAILVGDGRTGIWKRFYGFPSSEKVVTALTDIHKARQ